jgi:hypothetical protein
MAKSHLTDLPRYKQFIIPYIVLMKDGIPQFKINDDRKTEECIAKRLCSVCGKPLVDDMWMLGGPMSAFHLNGCYVDIPVHKECGVYSLKTCPYMAYTQYIVKPENFEKLQDKVGDLMLINPTMDYNRLQYFVFVRVSDYKVVRRPSFERFIYPNKPYLEVEFWKDGIHITPEEAALK